MYLTRMPDDAVVSHATAARLWHIPLPRAVESDERVHVAVTSPRRAPHARGLAGHSLELAPEDVVRAADIPLTSPGRTWVDLARVLDVPDLVAAGDFLIHRRRPIASVTELLERAEARPRQLGRRRLLRAVDLLDDRSESRPESLLRVLIVTAGLPRPQCNVVVRRREMPGEYRADLAYPDRQIAIEYQGDHHRDRAQWLADMRRRAELERLGWTVIEVTAADLRDPRGLLARLRAELAP